MTPSHQHRITPKGRERIERFLEADFRHQRWLALQLGVLEDRLSKWLRGIHSIPADHARELAKIVKRPMVDLFEKGG